jgi:hypothetical protein
LNTILQSEIRFVKITNEYIFEFQVLTPLCAETITHKQYGEYSSMVISMERNFTLRRGSGDVGRQITWETFKSLAEKGTIDGKAL